VNQAEYQRLRRQLDDELRAGMEMLQGLKPMLFIQAF
jgi:hypothetical protein